MWLFFLLLKSNFGKFEPLCLEIYIFFCFHSYSLLLWDFQLHVYWTIWCWPTGSWCIVDFPEVFFSVLFFFFSSFILNNLYIQYKAQTPDSKVKSCMPFWLSQPGATLFSSLDWVIYIEVFKIIDSSSISSLFLGPSLSFFQL